MCGIRLINLDFARSFGSVSGMAKTDKNQRAQAIAAIVARCRVFAGQYQDAEKRIRDAEAIIATEQASKKKTVAFINDCIAAARVLEFDLPAAMKKGGDATEVGLPRPDDTSVGASRIPIRELVLQIARDAAPIAIRASEVRKQIEAQRGPIHEKTVGMTLYRLSKDGAVRREGRDWYFVHRPTDPADGKKAATDLGSAAE